MKHLPILTMIIHVDAICSGPGWEYLLELGVASQVKGSRAQE